MIMILNRTTNEYFGVATMERAQEVVKEYLSPLEKKGALIQECVGESLWKRTDMIIIVPDHLQEYVRRSQINRLMTKPSQNR